jgi:SAM-dependent methyltransferase
VNSSSPDPKQGEREYFARIGEAGRAHAARKPFGDEDCLRYLINLSAIMGVMRPPPARIVEFGCGTGWLGLLLAERGYEVVGVDISPDAIAIAERLRMERGLGNISFRSADYEEFRLDPLADYAIFHDALHHAESEHAALAAAYAALRPGGLVICIEPGEGHGGSPSSRHAVETYGVHEKDMPPRTIFAHARAVGFRKHLVLPWPWDYLRTTYRPAYAKATGPGDLRGLKLLSFVRLLFTFWRTRQQGLVVLIKD